MSFSNSIRLVAFILSLLTTRSVAQVTGLSSIITEYYCPLVGKSTLLPGCGSYAAAFTSACAPLFSASKTAEYQSCANGDPSIVALECSCYNELLTCAGTLVGTASQLGNAFCGGATGLGPVIATTNSTSTSEGSALSSASASLVASSTVTSTGVTSESSGSASSSSSVLDTTTSRPETGRTATQTQASSTSSPQPSSNAAAGKGPMLNILFFSVGAVIAALV